ncbi:MAG: hypothetical protein E7408_04660 [Ruminococcaceae bacterium]|nr:hypothetical protein [Oscillospiraceae bacterium]
MRYKIYPVMKTEDVCDWYTVKINGKEVELNSARVSAIPFNRRWPGHQRDKSQSELVNFVSLETDEKIEFEIIPKEPFETVEIRPKSLNIKYSITEEKHILFTLEKPAHFTVEPFGRNHALHIFADPVSAYAVNEKDEDVIYFGKGIHDAGIIRLQEGQTLFIDAGAVVYGSVYAQDANNIRIIGRGILDNSKNKEVILHEVPCGDGRTDVGNAERRDTIWLEYCDNVEIDGITIRDSLVYNIRPVCCTNLTVNNVKIIGCWRYNSDGIDMHNCKNVRISGCFIRTFDDSVCVKGFDYRQNEADMYRDGVWYDSFQNIVVSDCTIWNDWGKCLEIGAETRAKEICDVTFKDCRIIHVMGRPLDICNVDYADVHDVCYENISVEYDDCIPQPLLQTDEEMVYENTDPSYAPALICAIIQYHPEYSDKSGRRGKIRNCTFENIRLYGKQKPEVYFKGYDETASCSNLKIRNLYWNAVPVKSFSDIKSTLGDFTSDITIE